MRRGCWLHTKSPPWQTSTGLSPVSFPSMGDPQGVQKYVNWKQIVIWGSDAGEHYNSVFLGCVWWKLKLTVSCNLLLQYLSAQCVMFGCEHHIWNWEWNKWRQSEFAVGCFLHYIIEGWHIQCWILYIFELVFSMSYGISCYMSPIYCLHVLWARSYCFS